MGGEKTLQNMGPRIGVLAIQGDYAAHAAALAEAGATAVLVRTAAELAGSGAGLAGSSGPDGSSGLAERAGLDGLVMPGGESTTMLKFLERGGLFDALRTFAERRPVFATCAGCILLAREVRNPAQRSLGVLDVAVERNAYGRQNESAILSLETRLEGGALEAVFIRAPRIVDAGPRVEVLAERDGFPVLVRQDGLLAATFHPELSRDRRVHAYFVRMIAGA